MSYRQFPQRHVHGIVLVNEFNGSRASGRLTNLYVEWSKGLTVKKFETIPPKADFYADVCIIIFFVYFNFNVFLYIIF